MARRTKEEAAATRELLLDTAEQVFLERGVSRASLQDIATAAGLTRGAIYWHFKDKGELFSAMMDRAVLPCEAVTPPGSTCSMGVSPSDDPLETLRRMVLRPLEQLRDDERTRRAFTIAIHRTEYTDDMRAARDRQTECIAGYLAELASLLSQAQAQGRIRADLSVTTVASVLFSMIDGLLSHHTLHPDPGGGVKTAETGLDLLLAGMQNHRP